MNKKLFKVPTHWKSTAVASVVAATFAFPVACKKQHITEWSESELESLQSSDRTDSPPPLAVVASIRRIERNSALKIFDDWAAKIISSQKKNANHPLNQLRKIFNPDHLKPLDIDSSIALVRTEGSGTHGTLAKERKPQDFLYHALWSRIADGAALVQYPRSSKHMKHFLGNSGKILRYSPSESFKIIHSLEAPDRTAPDPVGIQLEKNFLISEMKKNEFDVADSEAQMIAAMTRDDKGFFAARLALRQSLSHFLIRGNFTETDDLEKKFATLKNKKLTTAEGLIQGAWTSHRPIAKGYRLLSSPNQSDMYFAMGTFTVIHSATPLEIKKEGHDVKIRFSQWRAIFDRYNWDDGKFVTLLSGWCWNLKSDHCYNLEELLTLQVSDKSLARLHKLGLAREYDIHGKTPPATVWDSVSLKDLLNPRKLKYWEKLTEILNRDLLATEDGLTGSDF